MKPRLPWVVSARQLSPGRWEATARAGTLVLAERAATEAGALDRLHATIAAYERMLP